MPVVRCYALAPPRIYDDDAALVDHQRIWIWGGGFTVFYDVRAHMYITVIRPDDWFSTLSDKY